MARKSRKQKAVPEIIATKRYRTAIYARLSGKGRTEETIEAQVTLIRSFLSDKSEFQVVEIFEDDGYSGTNWDRPAFQRMMEAVRSGAVDCIIVKDLSRFAREHIGAEDYLNNIFPFLGVRFISVTDGYDNLKIEPQEYFMASFKNLAHAYFAQETSRKISQSLRVVQEKGLYIGSRAPFGYDLVPGHPHELRINEEQAAVVREIVERFVQGATYTEICKELNSRFPDGTTWTNARIGTLLKRELYIGTVVGHKTAQAMYKGEKCRKIPKDEQIRVENAAPAIISMELWDSAHKSLAERKEKRHEKTVNNPFRGLVFCELCGTPIPGVFNRKRQDYDFNCKHCKAGVYCSGKRLTALAAEHGGIGNIAAIYVRDRKHITLYDKEGGAP